MGETSVSQTMSQRAAMDGAVRHLVSNYSPLGDRIGWLMLASILVEAWDMYSIGFVLVFIRDQYHPDPLLLGLAAAATQAGAMVGSLLGGWLVDKLGRRVMFLSTMAMFIVLALAQAFVTSVLWLVIVRLFLGIPLGSDPTTGFSYIMEVMPKRRRELMGTRWQFVWAAGSMLSVGVVALFLVFGVEHELLWRSILGLGAVPALVILLMRRKLPETAAWLVRQGRFREAKQVSLKMYNDPLDMLPDHDVVVTKPRPAAFLADLRRDPVRWNASLYGWISGFVATAQFQTFGFYMPVLFTMVGVSSLLGTDLILILLYAIAALGGWMSPMLVTKIGHRGVGILGFSIVFVCLLVAAGALYAGHVTILPFAAAVMMWGQYVSVSNCMTVSTVVAKPEYRGTAGGVSYMFVKLAAFLAIFLFPAVVAALGQATSTLFVSLFALIGLLSAIFILPEVYGYDQD
jgi:predicted MFS family arabinose efflux permease